MVINGCSSNGGQELPKMQSRLLHHPQSSLQEPWQDGLAEKGMLIHQLPLTVCHSRLEDLVSKFHSFTGENKAHSFPLSRQVKAMVVFWFQMGFPISQNKKVVMFPLHLLHVVGVTLCHCRQSLLQGSNEADDVAEGKKTVNVLAGNGSAWSKHRIHHIPQDREDCRCFIRLPFEFFIKHFLFEEILDVGLLVTRASHALPSARNYCFLKQASGDVGVLIDHVEEKEYFQTADSIVEIGMHPVVRHLARRHLASLATVPQQG